MHIKFDSNYIYQHSKGRVIESVKIDEIFYWHRVSINGRYIIQFVLITKNEDKNIRMVKRAVNFIFNNYDDYLLSVVAMARKFYMLSEKVVNPVF